jgi:hypothetical protein
VLRVIGAVLLLSVSCVLRVIGAVLLLFVSCVLRVIGAVLFAQGHGLESRGAGRILFF